MTDYKKALDQLDTVDLVDELASAIIKWAESGEEFEIPCGHEVAKRHIAATGELMRLASLLAGREFSRG